MIIAAGKFKAQCLKLMDQVNRNHVEIIISKRGKPVAKLVPIENEPPRSIFGYLNNTVKKEVDIVQPAGEQRNAD